MKDRLGLDWPAIVVHAFVTILTAVAMAEAVGSAGNRDDVVIPLTLAAGTVLFEWRRRRALAAQPPVGLTTGEVQEERLDEMEAHLAELDLLHTRVAELEERLDFSERLLARQDARPLAVRLEDPR
jgi:hypothetical protein